MAYEDDARFQTNAYIVDDDEKILYRVLRVEHYGTEPVLTRLWLEDSFGVLHDKTYDFPVRWRTLPEVRDSYRLVRSAEEPAELAAAA